MSGGPEAPAPVSCRPASGGTITRERLHWRMPAGLTATVRGNPVEHSNIRVIESSGQARKCATGLRHHNLRTRHNRGNARYSGGITARDRPQFSDSMNRGTPVSSLRHKAGVRGQGRHPP